MGTLWANRRSADPFHPSRVSCDILPFVCKTQAGVALLPGHHILFGRRRILRQRRNDIFGYHFKSCMIPTEEPREDIEMDEERRFAFDGAPGGLSHCFAQLRFQTLFELVN